MPAKRGDADAWGLSPAEDDILDLIAQDYTDPEIAEMRTLSIHTVKTHVRHILQKLGVANRREAARLYRKSL